MFKVFDAGSHIPHIPLGINTSTKTEDIIFRHCGWWKSGVGNKNRRGGWCRRIKLPPYLFCEDPWANVVSVHSCKWTNRTTYGQKPLNSLGVAVNSCTVFPPVCGRGTDCLLVLSHPNLFGQVWHGLLLELSPRSCCRDN